MKGVIWKYHPIPNDPELKDEMGRAGCRVTNPDPDFWEHSFPLWAICGPWVRSTLDVGDILFFTPTKARSRAANLPNYVVTGYLTVAEILNGKKDLLGHPMVTARYKQNYRADLQAHLAGDKPTTARRRPQNIVIGDPGHSKWLGSHGQELGSLLDHLGIKRVDLNSRRVRDLSGDEAARLRSELARFS